MTGNLRPYSVYPAAGDWAVLVLAKTARDAKNLAWRRMGVEFEDFLAVRVRLIREPENVLPLANQKLLAAGLPHLVDNPASCHVCCIWGAGVTADGMCGYCNESPGGEVRRRLWPDYDKNVEMDRVAAGESMARYRRIMLRGE